MSRILRLAGLVAGVVLMGGCGEPWDGVACRGALSVARTTADSQTIINRGIPNGDVRGAQCAHTIGVDLARRAERTP